MSKRSESTLADNVSKITQIQDSILEAMKVYYQEQARNLKHDVTVDATIVDVSEKTDGVYTVSSDGARFKAYAISGSYYTNEAVLVSVPNGDYNNQKFILGRKTDGDTVNTTFSFKLPFDDFIGLQFVNEGEEYTGQFWANKPATDEQLIYHYEDTKGSLMGCTKLGIEADFTTLLGMYHPSRGTYGLRIVVSGVNKTTTATESVYLTEEYYFTNYDMYGNTYAYQVPYTQQKILDISNFLNVQEVSIYFFQDYLFADSANKDIPYKDMPANIEITNLHVYFGLTSDEIESEKTFLYTFDSLNYDETEEIKTLHFAWVHKEANGSFTVVKDLDGLLKQKEATGYDNTAIHWYRFRYGTVITDSTSPEKYGGVNWEYLEDFDNNFSIDIKPDFSLSREKYKVVVAHDGVHTTSDILTIQNSEDIEGFTANDEIIIKCLRTATDNNGNRVLVEDDAITTFYVYDENNRVLKNDEQEVFSDIDYYLQIWVRNNDLGEYVPMQIEDGTGTTGLSIAWAFPQSYTMFNSFEQITTNDVGFTGYDPDSNEFKNLQKITVKFKIKSILNIRYIDNTISAIISRNGIDRYIAKTFQFGRAGSFGDEVTPVIKIVNPKDGYYIPIQSGYFELRCDLYGRDGQLFEVSNPIYEWKLIGSADITEDIEGNGEMVIDGNTVKGVLQNNIPPIFEVTVRNAADYPITIRKGFLIGNDPAYMQQHVFLVPDRIEFKSDGASPIYYTNNFEVQRISEDDSKNHMEYPTWNISNEIMFTLKESLHSEDIFTYSDGSTITRDAYTCYALRPISLSVSPQWSETLTGNSRFTYIYYELDDGTYVAQSLAFDRNKYPSSLINSWNGTDLTIDEENNAVMAKMIAAGTKDINNRFTGVAMGDWSDKADESLNEAGIYGFANGEQSFAFKKDGSGFIGPVGKGRIYFDGTQALISNSDQSCYINLNPVPINLNTTSEDLLLTENRSFSQNFLFAKVPKTENIIQSAMPEDTPYWTKKYFEDDLHDYFVVDPSNGVMTSGGIIAKYGNIGNWSISSQGLYQKVSANEETGMTGKYMFLGYNGLSLENYEKEKAEIKAWYDAEKQKILDNYSEVMYLYDPVHYYNCGIGARELSSFIGGMFDQVDNWKNTWLLTNDISGWEAEESRYIKQYWADNSHTIYNLQDPGHAHYDSNGNVTSNTNRTGYGYTIKFIMRASSSYFLNSYSGNNNVWVMQTYYYPSGQDAYNAGYYWPRWTGEYTRAAFTIVANDAMEGYKISKAAYDQQLYEQEQAPIIRDKALADLEAEYKKRLNEIWKTGDSERFCIFAGENEYYDPYFSVSWDGTLSARKGIIGKTSPWKISDDGLTQENNFGRIFLGDPTKNSHNPWWFDNTTRVDLIQQNSTGTGYEMNDEGQYVGFAISAGDKTSDLTTTPTSMAMKFGVRLDGFLYSTRGLIGGWNITDTELVSVNAGIRMSSSSSYIVVGKGTDDSPENYSIILDGLRGIIAIKNQGTETATGQIQLAGYNFEARTAGTISYPHTLAGSETTTTYADIGGSDSYDNTNSWDGGGSFSVSGTVTVPNGSALTAAGVSTVTLASTNSIGIIDRNETGDSQGFGLGIVTGLTSNGQKSTVLYPVGTTAGYSSLGTTSALWNIYANIISCAGLDTAGYISARSLYMNNELVATQPYVYNLLVDVWNAIHSASSGVGSNASSIKGLGKALREGVATGIRWGDVGDGTGTMYLVNKDGGDIVGIPMVDASHAHPLSISGTLLSMEGRVRSTDPGVDLKHSHTGTATFNANGTVTITIDSSFNHATSATITSDSVTATTWFQDQLKAARQEGWDLAASIYQVIGNTIYGPGSVYGGSKTHTITASASVEVTASESDVTYTTNGTRTRTADASATATAKALVDGSSVATDTATGSDSDNYKVIVNVKTSSGSDSEEK